MPGYLGNTKIGGMYLGATKIGQAYLGSTLVYTSAGPSPTPSMPAGIVEVFAGSTVPAGFLLCDGSAVSRDTYAALFAVIGTTYGAGDGSTTFNLPDMTGRVPLGVSNDHALASTGGSETVTLDSTTIPSHVHTVPQHGHANDIKFTTPALSHTLTQAAFTYNKPKTAGSSSGSSNSICKGTTTSTASRSASIAISAHAATDCTMEGSVTKMDAFVSATTGGDGAHNNLQPFSAVNYIICTGD